MSDNNNLSIHIHYIYSVYTMYSKYVCISTDIQCIIYNSND